jgi:hypothetical protein
MEFVMNKNMKKGLLIVTLLSIVAPAMAIWPFASKRQVEIEKLQPVMQPTKELELREKTCRDAASLGRAAVVGSGITVLALLTANQLSDKSALPIVGFTYASILAFIYWDKKSKTARHQLQTRENLQQEAKKMRQQTFEAPGRMQVTPATGLTYDEHEAMAQE